MKLKSLFSFMERFALTEQDVKKQNLREALVRREEHQAAAEHHKALADMYDDRVRRLNPVKRNNSAVRDPFATVSPLRQKGVQS